MTYVGLVHAILLTSFLAAAPGSLEQLVPAPPECAGKSDKTVCIKWVLLHGHFTERLLILRDLHEGERRNVTAYIKELETLTTHWRPELRVLSQRLLRRLGRSNKRWPQPACPRQRDLESWNRVRTRKAPNFPSACGPVVPSNDHEVVFTPAERTCVFSTNRGEWGSSLTVHSDGRAVWTVADPLFHPQAVAPASGGYWIIESLNHEDGSGGLSFLSKDKSGKWRLRRIEEFPSTVEAWRVESGALELAISRSDLPEDPCKSPDGAVWIVAYGEGDHPKPELRQ